MKATHFEGRNFIKSKTLGTIFHHCNFIKRLLLWFTQTYSRPSQTKTRWSVVHVCTVCWKWGSSRSELFWFLYFLIAFFIYCHLRWAYWWKSFAWKCCHTHFAYFLRLWHLGLIFYLLFLFIKSSIYFNILVSHKEFIFKILIKDRSNISLTFIDHFTQRGQIDLFLAKFTWISFLFNTAFHNHFLKILILRNLG